MTRKTEQVRYPLQAKVSYSDPALLPGESRKEYEALATEIRLELSPAGPLEEIAVREIIALRWEMQRLRALRQKEATRWLAGLALRLMEEAGPAAGLRSEETRVELALRMHSQVAAVQQEALAEFERRLGIPAETLLPQAYADSDRIVFLDRRLDTIDRRYRAGVKDFRQLRERPLRSAA